MAIKRTNGLGIFAVTPWEKDRLVGVCWLTATLVWVSPFRAALWSWSSTFTPVLCTFLKHYLCFSFQSIPEVGRVGLEACRIRVLAVLGGVGCLLEAQHTWMWQRHGQHCPVLVPSILTLCKEGMAGKVSSDVGGDWFYGVSWTREAWSSKLPSLKLWEPGWMQGMGMLMTEAQTGGSWEAKFLYLSVLEVFEAWVV